jgi:glycosyltransferase involved in cell wall biosynthesis
MTDSSGVINVVILLATKNGEQYLEEQLDSFESQSIKTWRIVASDDGSDDNTLKILKRYQAKWGYDKLEIRQGPCLGYAHNFMSLANDKKIKADFFAFSDQDDVWLPQKLEEAIRKIYQNTFSKNIPSLYCGRTTYTSHSMKPYGESPLFIYPASFRNSLVQSIAGGNTMVFNKQAKSLLEKSKIYDIISHDWWCYQLISASGGVVIYDPTPWIFYRQHKNALIGENQSIISRLSRLHKLFQGYFREWTEKNINALSKNLDLFTYENKIIFDLFKLMRFASLKDRIRLFGVTGVYRQTRLGTFSLFIALLFNLI